MTSLRLAFRVLARRPGFAAAAIGTIGLAIGLNSTVFTFVAGVLSPLPYGEPERLVKVYAVRSGGAGVYGLASLRDVEDWRAARSLSAIAAVEESTVMVGEALEHVEMAYATPNLFDALAVAPSRGRAFVDSDTDQGAVVISDVLWRDLFDRDPAALGSTLRVAGRERTIIGIMPPLIGYPMYARLWLPFEPAKYAADRDVRHAQVIARLAPGASAADAAEELRSIAAALADVHPETNEAWTPVLRFAADDMREEMRPVAVLLFGAVFFVLLIACANVANLLLARGEARRREVAIRFTLGAHRRQVVAQLLLEAAIIGAAGGAIGLLLAVWGRDIIIALLPLEVPAWMTFGLDVRAVLFTAAVTAVAVLLSGLLPALRVTRGSLAGDARAGDLAGGRSRLPRALVVAETALAFMLLIGAGLLFRSAMNVQRADLGYDPTGVTSAFVRVEAARDGMHAAEQAADIVARVGRLGGVHAAALTAGLARERVGGAVDRSFAGRVTPDGLAADATAPQLAYSAVSADFFRVLDLPVFAGRGIRDSDGAGAAPVAVVSESAARRLWPGESDIIGRRLRFGEADDTTPWHTVVGISRDRRIAGYGRGGAPSQARAEVFVAAAPGTTAGMTLLFRAAPGAAPAALSEAVRRELAALAPDIDTQRLQPHESTVRHGGPVAWMASVLGGFAVAALGMAMLGLYGVIAYNVARRTREIGIRMALGAPSTRVRRMVIGGGLRLAGVGAAIGVLGGALLARLLSAMLFGLQPIDPFTFLAGAALLFGTAALAAWLPARAASRVEPVVALRSEA